MSVEHMDNFAQYGIGQQARLLNGIYAENGNTTLVADPDPSATPGSIVALLSGRPAMLRYVLGGLRTKVGMAGRFWLNQIPDSIGRIPQPFQFRDASNTLTLAVHVSTTGSLLVRSTLDESGTILAQTAGPVLTPNAWYHMECWVTYNGIISADIEIRVEGVTVLTANLPTITAGNCAQVATYTTRTSNFLADIPMYVKDFIIMNGNGSYNNSFVGSLTVYRAPPNSDVALNWTPSTGSTGYTILDNAPAIDTEYLAAGTPAPSPYRGGITNLPDDVTSIRAVMTSVRAQKVDGGDGNLQIGLISGASTGLGVNRPITSAMTYWRDVFEVDPNTSAPFLPGALDATDIQMNRTV